MITLCIMARNEAASIARTIKTSEPIVSNIIVVDDNSTDDTVKICEDLGATVIPHYSTVKDVGFAATLNFMFDQVKTGWILYLDGDELLDDPFKVYKLITNQDVTMWALPRRKWINYDENKREELEAFPDWQVRFFKAGLHEPFEGVCHFNFRHGPVSYAYGGPYIEHLQYQYRNDAKFEDRTDVYEHLAPIQGVHAHGGQSINIKKR